MPFIVPQEYGLHVDTRWFRIGDGATTLEVTPTVPLAFSALPYRAEDLTAVTHAHQLTTDPSGATFVHLDAAHRGLGTAACGPDTADRWKIRGGTFRWTWRMRARPAVSRPARRTRRATPSRRRSDRRACAG